MFARFFHKATKKEAGNRFVLLLQSINTIGRLTKMFFFSFLSGFSFTNIQDLQDSKGREGPSR